MRAALITSFMLFAFAAAAQTNVSLPKSCNGLDQHRTELKDGNAVPPLAALAAMEAKSAACIGYLLSQLPPEQRKTGQTALSVYEGTASQLTVAVRQRDSVETREQLERETRDAVYQMASLFARLAELSYRYNHLIDQVNAAVAAETGQAVTPAVPGGLPVKVEFLDCNDYHVGRFSACWPPD